MTIDSVLEQLAEEHVQFSSCSPAGRAVWDELTQSEPMLRFAKEMTKTIAHTGNEKVTLVTIYYILRCGMILGRARTMEEMLQCQQGERQ